MTSIDDAAALRAHYRDPHPLVLRKQLDHLDGGARSFIAASPFVVVASAAATGVDASPRGGPPGFVRVLDDDHLAFGDLSGNNRLDTYTNLTDRPDVGLLFFVPGVVETLRVNGRATVTDDPAVLDATAVDGRRARVAVRVEVAECYVHCGKASRRAGLWDPSSWSPEDRRPSPAQILSDHLGLPDASAVEEDLAAAYRHDLWNAGGAEPDGA